MTRSLMALGCALGTTANFAVAHHSFATFDMTKTVTISGMVRTFEWSNPHTWVWVDVTDTQGNVVTWGLEGSGPGELARHGWTKHSVSPGDAISVDIHPLKTGQPGGSYSKIQFADGHVLSAGGSGGPGSSSGEGPPSGDANPPPAN